ncbi:restriction endonuclease subunit S (plasmid) [Lentilactobacillus kefiri]|uniref:restriction endonuclease subunit S n=1 Tax=Lentilactobacillus kefiri TaxID=33962 RepID=UPI001FB3127C|nr:restriction endonuclease subunit S [Lentilactobacillus kefiri]UOD79421.1 restriction endonuclease subunit S [Lentilactobacillus kefiri]
MKDNQAKYPQLRFKGFTDPWEQRKLGEEAQLTMGQSPNSENYTENPDDYILVQGNADMKNSRVVPRVWTTQVTKKAEKSDLILSVRAPVGDIGKTDYDVVLGRGVAAIKGNEFIFQQLGKMKLTGYWTRYSTGSTFESINSNDIKDAKIMVPVEEEQQKIGSFFKQLDHLITLHQRKLAKLKELKQGYLQKMFPQNGSKFPQLRFAGFADAWEQRKLGDVVGEIQSGNRLPKDSLTSGNIPYVVAQTKNEGVFKTISKKTLDYNGNPMKLFPGNSISFSIDNPKAMFYRSTEFYTSNIMRVIHADYLSHQQYLFILENMKSFTRRYDWSRKFSGPVVSNLEYLQPNEQEQCKIGSFILAFDNIITLHQRKLEKLQELKKGYLQKMFC